MLKRKLSRCVKRYKVHAPLTAVVSPIKPFQKWKEWMKRCLKSHQSQSSYLCQELRQLKLIYLAFWWIHIRNYVIGKSAPEKVMMAKCLHVTFSLQAEVKFRSGWRIKLNCILLNKYLYIREGFRRKKTGALEPIHYIKSFCNGIRGWDQV